MGNIIFNYGSKQRIVAGVIITREKSSSGYFDLLKILLEDKENKIDITAKCSEWSYNLIENKKNKRDKNG